MNTRYNYFPVDFCKFLVKGKDCEEYKNQLMGNQNLNFKINVCESTGEINYSYLKHKGMLLKIHSYGRITLQGSLHMLKNNGVHNHDQFTQKDFKRALKMLERLFYVVPMELYIIQLEYGLNITGFKSHDVVTQILNGLLLHKNCKFSQTIKMGMNTCFVEHSKTTIKIYDKGGQYCTKEPILRVEVRQDCWEVKLRYEYGIKTLQDFINVDKKYFVDSLLKKWDEIIFFDYSIPELRETIYDKKSFWNDDYLKLNRMQKKRVRDDFNSIIQTNKGNMKNVVRSKLLDTINALNEEAKFPHLNTKMLRLSS